MLANTLKTAEARNSEMTQELKRARKALRELGQLLKSLADDPSPSAVHGLRITTRRVEAIAEALQPGDEKRSKRLMESIGPVRKAAGGVRDMDVVLADARRLARYSAGPALTRLLEYLRIARFKKAETLKRTLRRRGDVVRLEVKEYSRLVRDSLDAAKGDAEMALVRPESMRSAVEAIAHELSLEPALDAENIHAFRIKVKKLRYILQLSADTDAALLEALGAAQHAIGDWHDWQHLRAIAHEVLTGEGDRELLERIDRIASRKLEQAQATANALRRRYFATVPADGV